MTNTLSSRPTAHSNPVRLLKASLFAALAAYAASFSAASAAPTMGAVDVTVFKHPQYGCPAQVELYLSSYATGWPDGEAMTPPECVRSIGSMASPKLLHS